MFNLKHKLPIWIMGAFAVMAFLSTSYFYEYLEVHIRRSAGEGAGLFCPMHLFVIIFYVGSVLLGWLYLMFWKDQLKPRLHWFWTTYGLSMIAWMLFVHLPFSVARSGLGWGLSRIWNNVDTFYWGLGFGILYAFYSLRSAKPLWYFMFPMSLIGIIASTNAISELSRMPENLVWGISDLMVIGSMTVVTLYFVLQRIGRFFKLKNNVPLLLIVLGIVAFMGGTQWGDALNLPAIGVIGLLLSLILIASGVVYWIYQKRKK